VVSNRCQGRRRNCVGFGSDKVNIVLLLSPVVYIKMERIRQKQRIAKVKEDKHCSQASKCTALTRIVRLRVSGYEISTTDPVV